jgi:nitric oxide reductase subunit B
MPPIPDKFVTTEGVTLIDSGEIGEGQNVWQSLGGMEVGSVWGHGSYVAPDWTADWLHREAVFILDKWANAEFSKPFDRLDEEHQGQLVGRLVKMMHANTFDETTGVVTIDPVRSEAFAANVDHYRSVFIDGNADYAIPAGAVASEERLHKLSAFYFWTSWAAATTRPGDIAKLYEQLAA